MIITHTLRTVYQVGPNQTIEATTEITGDAERNGAVVLSPEAANVVYNFGLAPASAVSFALYFAGGDCQVKTYNGATLKDEVDLTTAIPMVACANNTAVLALLPGGEFTSMKLSSTSGGTLYVRSLSDNTP